MRLNDNVAAITGAGSGIGREIALRFAGEGARVAVCDIDTDGAADTVHQIEAAHGSAMAVEMDVTDEQSVNRGIDKVAGEWDRVDTLVSNAGIQIVKPIEDFSFEDFKKLMAIHVDGAFLTTRACVRYMYPQKSGSLIYMGSVHSHEASPMKSAYVSAKHALLGLARVMAEEGAQHGVRANVICPGFVKTSLVEKQIPEQARNKGISEQQVVNEVMLGDTVDGEFTTMEDVAETALLFAAFPSNALTGQSVVVSHGWHMN